MIGGNDETRMDCRAAREVQVIDSRIARITSYRQNMIVSNNGTQ